MQLAKIVSATAALLGWAHGIAAAPLDASPENTLAALREQAIEALTAAEGANEKRGGCTLANASVRKDWERMSKGDRKEYIRAVQCLLRKPSKSDPAFAPGARNRYDDFVAVHINQTRTIHNTGNFLTWHRYYVWAYEKALKDECGYKGAQPYWNWFKYQDDLTKSPLFDGSDTSLSGDGAFVQHNGSYAGIGRIYLPPGDGGGCVTSGPLKDMVVNLGPVAPVLTTLRPNPNGAMGHNPRCLSRDLNVFAATSWMTHENLVNITAGAASHSVAAFQAEFQGGRPGFLGMHAAGHFIVNGDAGDLFASPADPVFFLHHAMVDLVYWLWQALHPAQARTIAGTVTMNNNPPSRNATLDDPVSMGVNAPDEPIGRLLDSISGAPFCYIYL